MSFKSWSTTPKPEIVAEPAAKPVDKAKAAPATGTAPATPPAAKA